MSRRGAAVAAHARVITNGPVGTARAAAPRPAISPAITVSGAPSPAEFTALFAALDRATAPVAGHCLIEPLALLLHDDAGEVTGGLWGRVVYGWLVIEMLFVPEELRGTGTGTGLIRTAEAEARRRGCIGLQVTRLDFQAPAFYERLGFIIFGVQADVPRGHSCTYLLKRLDVTQPPGRDGADVA